MTVQSIRRDYGDNITIVRMVTNDIIEDIAATGYITAQSASIAVANNGEFTWTVGDAVLIQDVTGANTLWNIFADFRSVVPVFPLLPNLQNIFAHAGGGQALAVQLNPGFNVVITVATAADSAILPVNVLGQTVIVTNKAANAMNVFPGVGDSINALAVDTALSVAAGATTVFYGITATNWVSK